MTEDKASYEMAETDMNWKESKKASFNDSKPGITLEWNNIHYTVSKKDPKTKLVDQKILLHSMSGKALPGELLGIMGTSGAGYLIIYYL
jgi:ABC-type glutathione transport system ATPase component